MMRRNHPISDATDTGAELDPRDQGGDVESPLATRSSLPLVSQRRPGRDGLALLGGFIFVGIVGAVTFLNLDQARHTPPAAEPASGLAAPSEAPVQVPPVVPNAAITPLPGTTAEGQMPAAVNPAQPPMAPVVAVNPYASPAVVFDSSALPLSAPAAAQTPAGMPVAGTPVDEFANRVGGIGGATAVASAGINPKATVTQGTLIPAVLETAIDTDVPGYVRAIVSADVRSFDGSRVLIPRSSRLIGQYRSGLQAGQRRAYVIWSRLIRPDGVSVNIASPAIGFSGETGLAGKVDTRFFERFGSGMLLSVIGGLSALGGNAGVVVAGGGQSAAAAAVGQTAQIGPTVRVRQGEPIRVFTARDLDFSKVTPE